MPNYYEKKVRGSHQIGLIAVVHTFGSDLKWNPHVHALFTECGIDKNNKCFKKISHIPYENYSDYGCVRFHRKVSQSYTPEWF